MKICLRDGLPFIAMTLEFRGRRLVFENVLLDTGSAGTVFATDRMADLGLVYEAEDTVHRIRGVGGAEFVFSKRVDSLTVERLRAADFEIEVGAMDYGFTLDGIVGVDWLTQIGAVIDLARLEIR